uniref:Uncharacterized protein n=1 Tax=Rhizophora mucronata TaxID=61149 RepID=A0A2P2PIK5_RHIMU
MHIHIKLNNKKHNLYTQSNISLSLNATTKPSLRTEITIRRT